MRGRGATILLATCPALLAAAELVVGPRAPFCTITAAVSVARSGDRVVIESGVYREPTIVVRVRGLSLIGRGWPVLDGEGARAVLILAAESITVRGLVVRGTGVSNLEDRAGIRARDAHHCRIDGNRLRDNLFGIYLERSADCVVTGNDIEAHGLRQTSSGNGIHLWYSPGARIAHNRVRGHRDGIYFEFSSHGRTTDNVAEQSQRYGLHFMFSDSCRYERNTFRSNNSGVAVMYSRGVVIAGNQFVHSWGPASYGLLLKDILGAEIADNLFEGSSTGLHVEGSARLDVRGNRFERNGWAIRVLADADESRFHGNVFRANAFDVATNSRRANATFDHNWWDAYRGYDLDRDGIGDIPFRPVRLFALVVERHPAALVLLR
ncbi:MAG: nitrous oxide reductase family maturation protein NosD, partial [Gemmatimonadaceae bacterium]|nr:nitrous oxide reductase family maturation protein NosD [Gemmatimonadaceae bacterium]